MGGYVTYTPNGYEVSGEPPWRRHQRGAEATHRALRRHPNFQFPRRPSRRDGRAALVTYVLDAVAAFISPPKVPHEHEEFACEDLAEAIRTQFKPELLRELGLAQAEQSVQKGEDR